MTNAAHHNFLDNLARARFGITVKEAHDQGICIKCKLDVTDRGTTEMDIKEYQISGVCGICFDELFKNVI